MPDGTLAGEEAPRYRTAQQMVVDQLRSEILSGKLPPGARVVQAEVARRMGVSTTPVREALRELASRRLLDLQPHHEVKVHTPTEQELVEVYEMRLLLEPAVITKVIDKSADDELRSAESFLKKMEHAADAAEWLHLARQFHTFIDGLARSPELVRMVSQLRDRSVHYTAVRLRSTPHRAEHRNAQHRALLEACLDRDRKRAIATVKQHVESTVALVYGSDAPAVGSANNSEAVSPGISQRQGAADGHP